MNHQHRDFFARFSNFFSAKKVLFGKAIAVQFFTDLTEQEKITYVKTKLPNEAVK
jgi:hypothetical protein